MCCLAVIALGRLLAPAPFGALLGLEGAVGGFECY